MDENESVSPTEDVGDLLGIGEPSAESVAASEPETVTEASAAPDQAQEPVSSQQEPNLGQSGGSQTPPTPQVFRIGDRDYTAQEIEAWRTSAQQLPHLQNKYVETLEKLRNTPQQPSPAEVQQPSQTPQAYMEALRQKYDPVVKKAAENGLLSQDFVTLFPGEAAQMVHYQQQFEQMTNVMRAVAGEMQTRQRTEQSSGLVNEVARSISNLAQSGEPFAPLKDPAKVQEFFNYLWEENPPVSRLRQPDYLARQWVAFNKDQYLQTAQTRASQAQRTTQARLARADATGGTRAPGINQAPEQTPLDELWQDHLDRSR